jgi:predicted nucleotide-binding protein (sugar kinase/HSP70/actin superfamily)
MFEDIKDMIHKLIITKTCSKLSHFLKFSIESTTMSGKYLNNGEWKQSHELRVFPRGFHVMRAERPMISVE